MAASGPTPSSKPVHERIQDVMSAKTSSEKLKQNLQETERKLKENQEKLTKEITEYNEKYSVKPWYRESMIYETKLDALDPKDPEVTIQTINRILDTPYEFEGIKYKLEEKAPSADRIGQVKALKELKKLLETQSSLLKKQKEDEDAIRKHQGVRLSRMSDRITDMQEKRSEFEKRAEYQALESDYESVFGSIIGRDPEFRRFYERPNGTIDPFLERESKQLFFAMLSHETDAFKTSFVLGDRFGENSAENKKNFPFIYHEWLTRVEKVDTNEMDRRSNQVQSKEAELKGKNIPEVSDMVKDINARITSNPDVAEKIGRFRNPLDKLSKKTPSQKKADPLFYKDLITNLNLFDKDIDLAIRKLDSDKPEEDIIKKELSETQLKLNERISLAKLQLKYEEEKWRISDLDAKFTRSELEKNRQTMMELAMRKFQKAMQIVDSPFNGHEDFHRNLNPAVRRQLIATVYYHGTSRYTESGEYIESRAPEYQWMFSQLTQSPYFNRGNKEKFLDPEQREFLQLASFANLALFSKQHVENELIAPWETGEMKPILDQLKLDLATPAGSRNEEIKDRIATAINGKPGQRGLQQYTRIKVIEENALTIIDELKKEVLQWDKLHNEAKGLMEKPDRQKIRDFIEKTKISTVTLQHGINNSELMSQYAGFAEAVDVNYNTLDFKEKSTGNVLERMGINPEGIYQAYLVYQKEHPEMKSDQWDNHLTTKGGTEKLSAMFGAILTDSSIYKGREDFLAVFGTLHGFNLETNQETLGKDQSVALGIYKTIQKEIEQREQMEAITVQGNEAALSKLRGETFGDKITKYGRGVFDMLVGPGRSLSERAAGAVILIAAFKMAQKAWKGEGAMGKTLRVVFMAAAGEIALKKLTGEGLTDKLRLSGVAETLSGTYEDVLLDRGKEQFAREEITETEHAATLMELRDIPFYKLMEWDRNTKTDGTPLPGKERTKLPRGINIYNIVPGKVGGNKKIRAQRIVKRTIENFFGYVGNKEDGDAGRGRDILNEIWVKAIKGNVDVNSAEFTRRGLPPELIKELRRNPRSITWQMVMQAEIRPADVEKVKGEKPLQQVADYLSGKAHDLERWSRNDIEQPVGAAALAFWANVKGDYVPRIKNFLAEMGEKRGRDLTYYKDKVEFMYDQHKVTIGRIGDQHWELITEGVKLPFQVLYAADQFVVPYLNTKIRQTREILRSDSIKFLERPLEATDIMSTNVLAEMKKHAKTAGPLAYLFLGKKKNPEAKYFGEYQPSFHEAFLKTDKYNEVKKIGYHISETTPEQAGIKPEDSVENQMSKLQIQAHKDAVKMFKAKHPELSEEQIVKYMYPIHVYAQTAEKGSQKPAKLYTFWRMPLPESEEFQLKENGRWTDYMDPNKYKDRPAFIVNPEKGIISNLTRAFGLQSPALRRGFDYMTSIVVAQGIALYSGIADKLTDATAGIAETFDSDSVEGNRKKGIKANSTKYQWLKDLGEMKEPERQRIDEWLGSAGHTGLALSKFYKNEKNAGLYQTALDQAIKNPDTKQIRLDNIEDWDTSAGKRGNPEDFSYKLTE